MCTDRREGSLVELARHGFETEDSGMKKIKESVPLNPFYRFGVGNIDSTWRDGAIGPKYSFRRQGQSLIRCLAERAASHWGCTRDTDRPPCEFAGHNRLPCEVENLIYGAKSALCS